MNQIANETHVKRWPEPQDMKTLAEAVNKKQSTVQLNGTKFKIRYKTKFNNAVFVSPVKDGIFVPCGYFNVDKLHGLL